jgi:cytochrome c-type biogenesis protein
MAVPFLIAALGVGWVTEVLKKYGKAMQVIEIVMGIILIIVGVMLFLGIYQQLATFDSLIDFGV